MMGNEVVMKDTTQGADNWYEVERATHHSDIPVKAHCLDDVKKMLYTDYNDTENEMTRKLLSVPVTKRNEVKEAKSRLDEFAKFKE